MLNENEHGYRSTQNSSEPRVTVVVHTYNQVDSIGKCLAGIVEQEYFAKMNVLIIDDCSSDDTVKACEIYQERYPDQISIASLAENELSKGLYVGIDHYRNISTKYISWCDGDDYWIDPLKTTKQVSVMESNPMVGVTHSDYLLLKDDGHVCQLQERSSREILKSSQFDSNKKLAAGNHVKQSTAMLLRQAIDLDFVAASRGIKAGDWLMCVSASRERKIHFIDSKTTVVRISEQGIWNGMTTKESNDQKSLFRWYCASHLPECPLRDEFRRYVLIEWTKKRISKSLIYKFVKPIVSLIRLVR